MEKNPYKSPEMYTPDPEGNEQEGVDYLSGRGGEHIHSGDQVTVVRTDGNVEHDWVLRSFGAKATVLERPSTGDRKVIPVEDFTSWQILYKDHEGNINTIPKVSNPAQKLNEADVRNNATRMGIDVSDPDWKNKYQKKIRGITG